MKEEVTGGASLRYESLSHSLSHTHIHAHTVVTCGPEGCNLFVFHIPNDMSNMDLYNIFSAYGTVVSVR